MGLFRKSDKECAQRMTAAAVVARGDQKMTRRLIEQNMTPDEITRGAAYIESGQPITGRR